MRIKPIAVPTMLPDPPKMLEPPRTMIHSDFVPDNIFFPTSQGGVPFALTDWQMVGHGRGPYDVAMLCGLLSPDVRRRNERELLRLYHSRLVERGVHGYSPDDCWRDYRRSLMSLLFRVAGVIADPGLAEGNEKFRDLWFPRYLSAVVETGAIEVLP